MPQPAVLIFSGGTAFNSVAGKPGLRQCAWRLQVAVVGPAESESHSNIASWDDSLDLRTAGSLQNFTTRIAHVLPVSDDGGSTAEIVRVLGGPAVGDIRSRCLRLADDTSAEVGTGDNHTRLACQSSACRPVLLQTTADASSSTPLLCHQQASGQRALQQQ